MIRGERLSCTITYYGSFLRSHKAGRPSARLCRIAYKAADEGARCFCCNSWRFHYHAAQSGTDDAELESPDVQVRRVDYATSLDSISTPLFRGSIDGPPPPTDS